MLKRVTITGADDGVGHPELLLAISKKFPFVEWGILVSAGTGGLFYPRFPSFDWIAELQNVANEWQLDLSLHVCGGYVRDILHGRQTLPSKLLSQFQRVQLNFHQDRAHSSSDFKQGLMYLGGHREIIFQLDGMLGESHLDDALRADTGQSCVPLFDSSGGTGVLPDAWPPPSFCNKDGEDIDHGYAGGLSPENLAEQLPKILQVAKDTNIWIDVETHVRSTDNRRLDIDKVTRFLEVAKPFVSQ